MPEPYEIPYGNIAEAGINYVRGNRDARDVTAAGAAGAAAADPFASQRPRYQTELGNLMTDPSSVASLPGYQFQLDQGIQARNRGYAARGQGNSGTRDIELTKYGQDYAASSYQTHLGNLMKLAGVDSSSPATAGSITSGAGESAVESRSAGEQGLTSVIGQGIGAAFGRRMGGAAGRYAGTGVAEGVSDTAAMDLASGPGGVTTTAGGAALSGTAVSDAAALNSFGLASGPGGAVTTTGGAGGASGGASAGAIAAPLGIMAGTKAFMDYNTRKSHARNNENIAKVDANRDTYVPEVLGNLQNRGVDVPPEVAQRIGAMPAADLYDFLVRLSKTSARGGSPDYLSLSRLPSKEIPQYGDDYMIIYHKANLGLPVSYAERRFAEKFKETTSDKRTLAWES